MFDSVTLIFFLRCPGLDDCIIVFSFLRRKFCDTNHKEMDFDFVAGTFTFLYHHIQLCGPWERCIFDCELLLCFCSCSILTD